MTAGVVSALDLPRDQKIHEEELEVIDLDDDGLPVRRNSTYAACVEKRKVLERKFGCSDIQKKLGEADNYAKIKFLRQIYEEFDEDGSGEIDLGEFFVCLQTCGFRVSRAAAMVVMK